MEWKFTLILGTYGWVRKRTLATESVLRRAKVMEIAPGAQTELLFPVKGQRKTSQGPKAYSQDRKSYARRRGFLGKSIFQQPLKRQVSHKKCISLTLDPGARRIRPSGEANLESRGVA